MLESNPDCRSAHLSVCFLGLPVALLKLVSRPQTSSWCAPSPLSRACFHYFEIDIDFDVNSWTEPTSTETPDKRVAGFKSGWQVGLWGGGPLQDEAYLIASLILQHSLSQSLQYMCRGMT